MRVSTQLVVAQSAGLFLALALALFLPAGTLTWLVGWVYLMLFFGFFLGVNAWLYRHNPGLLQERLSLSRADQKAWDKRLFPLLLVLPFAWLVVISADAVRFHWSREPVWLQLVGAVLLGCSFYSSPDIQRELVFVHGRARTNRTWAFSDLDGSISLCAPPDVFGISALYDRDAAIPGVVVRSPLGARLYDIAGETSGIGGTHVAGRAVGLCSLLEKVKYRLVPYVW